MPNTVYFFFYFSILLFERDKSQNGFVGDHSPNPPLKKKKKTKICHLHLCSSCHSLYGIVSLQAKRKKKKMGKKKKRKNSFFSHKNPFSRNSKRKIRWNLKKIIINNKIKKQIKKNNPPPNPTTNVQNITKRYNPEWPLIIRA